MLLRRPLVVALGAACASFAHAQTPTVLKPVVISASRVAQPLDEVLNDVTVLEGERLRSGGQQSVGDLLRQNHGLEVVSNGAGHNSTSVLIRGANSAHTLVYLDGLRVGSATTGTASLNALPLANLEKIEILRGAASSVYGASAIGGVVQLTSRQSSQTPLNLNAEVGTGRWGEKQATLSLSGAQQDWNYALGINHGHSQGFNIVNQPRAFNYNPDRDGYERQQVLARLGRTFAPDQTLDVSFYRANLQSEYDSSSDFTDRTRQRVQAVSIRSRNRLTSHWTSQLTLGQSQDNSRDESRYGGEFNTRQQQVTWQNEWQLAPQQQVTVAFERLLEQVDSTSYAANAPKERTTHSVTGIYRGSHSAHLWQMNVRSDHTDQYGQQNTGAVSYGYLLSPSWRLHANVGTGFRAPTFNELYYPGYGQTQIRPEKSRNSELSLRYDDGQQQASLTTYRNRVRDLIVTQNPCSVSGYSYGCANNVNSAVLEGLSAHYAYQWADVAQWGVDMDWQNPHDVRSGKLLPRRAKRHVSLFAAHQRGDIRYQTEWQASSRRFDDVANSTSKAMGGYGVMNWIVDYRLDKQWRLVGRLNNVFNKHYEEAKGYTPPERNLFISLQYQL